MIVTNYFSTFVFIKFFINITSRLEISIFTCFENCFILIIFVNLDNVGIIILS